MRTTLITTALLLGLLGTATACTSSEPQPNVTVTETTDEANTEPTTDDSTGEEPAGIDQLELTEVAMEMTWDQATDKSKDDMCAGLDMFGVDWAAEQLRTGGGTDAELDWDHAASLIEAKCALR